MARPNCHACVHFRVTWDARLRYECRAFGIRSARLPSIVVGETSGQECQLFRPKPRPDSRDDSREPPAH